MITLTRITRIMPRSALASNHEIVRGASFVPAGDGGTANGHSAGAGGDGGRIGTSPNFAAR
jgi:hypothetical protein